MKKNRMMRLASILLVCVLLSTSVISGTFAKYTTSDSAQDSARVAKWGVTVDATGNSFAQKYNDAANDAGVKVVSTTKVVAPGTNGTLGGVTISGTPEVMVNVDANATLTLSGWEITGDWDNDPKTAETKIEYCPIVFTVGQEKIKIDGTTIKDVAGLQSAVVAKFNALDKSNVSVGTDLAAGVSIDWAWDFDDNGAGTYDVKDTKLGNLQAAPTIAFTCDVTVTQVD